MPSTAYNAKGLLISAIRDDGPVVVMEHKFLGFAAKGDVPEEAYTYPIGKAEVRSQGQRRDAVRHRRMTHICLEAADRLAAEGVSAEVVDVLDAGSARRGNHPRVGAAHASARRRRRGHARCLDGARHRGDRVADKCFDWLDAPVKTVTAPNTPMPFAAQLEAAYIPNAEKVVAAVRAQIG